MFGNQQPIERDILQNALNVFEESTGFDFINIINDSSLGKTYYDSDKEKDLSEYLIQADETYKYVSEIRDDARYFVSNSTEVKSIIECCDCSNAIDVIL